MALFPFTTKCPCGADISAKIRKPTRFADSFAKVNCDKCRSRFLLTCVRDKDEPGRKFTTHIDMLELTPMAEKILSGQLPVRGKIALEKVKNAIGIHGTHENSVIETDMDNFEE